MAAPPPQPEPPRDPQLERVREPSRADLRLYAHALAEWWPISIDSSRKWVAMTEQIRDDPKATLRAKAAAARLATMMRRSNLARIETALRCRTQEELDARLRAMEEWRESHGQTEQS